MLTLITGGIRSGKSAYALEQARQIQGLKCFVATAEPLDEEMKIRIKNHQAERSQDFYTLEEPLHLSEVLKKAPAECRLILIDCLTLWVNNLLFYFQKTPEKIQYEINQLIETLRSQDKDIVFVTNEVGLGLVSENALSRQYVDLLGSVNQKIAKLCDEVVLMISGIPVTIKGEIHARLG